MVRSGLRAGLLAGIIAPLSPISAQELPQSPPEAVQVQSILPKGTLVPVELVRSISSDNVVTGDRFPVRTFEPVLVNGTIVIPADTPGEGEVVHAAKASRQGMPGELIVAARFIRCGTTSVRLGHLQFSSSGRDRTMAWIVERSIFRYPSQVKGNISELSAGTRGLAKVSADTPLSSLADCTPPLQSSNQGSAK